MRPGRRGAPGRRGRQPGAALHRADLPRAGPGPPYRPRAAPVTARHAGPALGRIVGDARTAGERGPRSDRFDRIAERPGTVSGTMESFGARLAEASRSGDRCAWVSIRMRRCWRPGDCRTRSRDCERSAKRLSMALADLVPVLKPQSAFFERFGSAGIAVMESTIRQSREAGALVIAGRETGRYRLDGGRRTRRRICDPASPLQADAITVSALPRASARWRPFFDEAAAHGGGVFVLARDLEPRGAADPARPYGSTADGGADGARRGCPAQPGCCPDRLAWASSSARRRARPVTI